MKHLFSIAQLLPNLLTAMNLLCGCIACILAMNLHLNAAFLAVLAGTCFDFFDGFMARWLKVNSAFGKQLDSFADSVNCGLAPGLIMYQLICATTATNDFSFHLLGADFGFSFVAPAFFALLLPVGAATRLAFFNIGKKPKTIFKGLPTPAAALLIAPLPLLLTHSLVEPWSQYFNQRTGLALVSLTVALLMNAPINFFSLKINFKRRIHLLFFIVLVLCSLPFILYLQWAGLPFCIMLYLMINLVMNIVNPQFYQCVYP